MVQVIVYVDTENGCAYLSRFDAMAGGLDPSEALQLDIPFADSTRYLYLCGLPDGSFITYTRPEDVAAASLAKVGLSVRPVRMVGRHSRRGTATG